jgi:hypothetical protein
MEYHVIGRVAMGGANSSAALHRRVHFNRNQVTIVIKNYFFNVSTYQLANILLWH